jgi:hypothetical protein
MLLFRAKCIYTAKDCWAPETTLQFAKPIYIHGGFCRVSPESHNLVEIHNRIQGTYFKPSKFSKKYYINRYLHTFEYDGSITFSINVPQKIIFYVTNVGSPFLSIENEKRETIKIIQKDYGDFLVYYINKKIIVV